MIRKMPSPVAHSFFALTLIEALPQPRRLLGVLPWSVYFCVLAVLPDFDFLLVAAGWHRQLVHRTFSHSVFFVLLAGALLAWSVGKMVMRGPIQAVEWYATHFWAVGSHVLLDMLAPDRIPPSGVMVFWPLSASFYLISNPASEYLDLLPIWNQIAIETVVSVVLFLAVHRVARSFS